MFNKEMLKLPFLIAIDGPAGSGKGTVAKILSQKLDLNYLDSGAIYRLIALSSSKANINQDDASLITRHLSDVDIKFIDGQAFLNGIEVSKEIRAQEVGKIASKIAQHIEVRKQILELQRGFFYGRGLVAEGRDMTTVVFPNADLKIYLDASPKERAKRRYKQLISKGIDANITDLAEEIKARDRQDMERLYSPLLVAKTANVLNSDDLSIDQTVDKIILLLKDKH